MTAKQPSTQDNVPIAGIKDGVVILKNGQYRIILSVSAINFALKSEQEQNSIVFNYQSFLNSLHFPIEIMISSKKLDLTPYLNRVKKLADAQKNDLLKVQTEDYVDFVSQLINMANIMKKSFYATVGYQPLTVSGGGFLDKLFKKSDQPSQIRVSEEEFNKYAGELRQRASTVAQGLGSIGLHCKQMTTEEIIELLYGTYNPEVAGKERLSEEAGNFSSTIVSQSKGEQDLASGNGEPVNGAITIDNTEIVNAQQKKMLDEQKLELKKAAEKNIKAPETAKAPDPAPAKQESTVPETTKIDLNTIRSVPASPKLAETPQALPSTSGVVSEDVKEPILQAQTATVATEKTAIPPTDADKAAQDPANNKDFGW